MEPNQQKEIERLLAYKSDPELAILDELAQLTDNVKDISERLKGVPVREIEALKGEDGYTPKRGEDYYTDDEQRQMQRAVQDNAVAFLKGEVEIMKDELRTELSPIKGIDYNDGNDGMNGIDGITPVKRVDYFTDEDINEIVLSSVDYLEALEGDARLDASALKNIEKNIDPKKFDYGFLSLDAKQIRNLPKMPESTNAGGGNRKLAWLNDITNAASATSGQILSKRADGRYEFITASGIGDMLVSTYDPDGIGANVYSADNHVDGTTNKVFTATEKTKLSGIEDGADVTDATNVAAAGAVMEGDTSTASMSFVVDEDNMASNSATKLPTQQSVKAYVDTAVGAVSGGLSDGDKGDITVASSGASWTIDTGVVTYAKMQDVSATDKVLGRSSAGSGDVEEIACTAAGRAILDDTTAADQRTTLGVGTGDSPQFTAINLGHASDTTLTRASAGVVAVEGVPLATTTITDGKENYHGIQSHGTLSFNNTSHVLTVGAATNTYWFQGVKYTTASAITCDLDSYVTLTANTLYFVAFDDATGTLKASATAWGLTTHVPVATVFWNGSAGSVCEETHGHTRDLDWHAWAHLTVGARYGSGLSLTAPTTAADATLTIESGSIYDEDHVSTIAQQTTSRIWYQVSSGVYTFVDSTLPYAGTSGNPQYLDTDTYTLTDTADNDWVNMWVYATPDIDRPIHIIPTQAATAHGTITIARAEQPPALSGLNLAPEMKLIYKFIYDGDGNFIESVDYRNASVLPAGGTASTSASAVSFVPAGNIAATTVQTAIEELDAEKAAVAQTFYIGTTQVAINRESAALTLAGLTLTTPNIGTPSAGTLTNCTGLPLSGVTDSTSEALGVGTLELGHASDTTLARVSAGVVSIEGSNILTTATGLALAGGTMTGNITLGESASVDLDPSLSADGKYSGIAITGTAGAALAFGDIVYYNSSSKWVLADADTAAAGGTVMLGMCVLAATGDTEPTKVLLQGNIRADTAFPTFTVGGAIYLSTTDGDVTQTAPTGADDVVRVVGWALTADSMVFMPSPSYITHTG